MSIPISTEYNNLINNDDFIFNISYFTESNKVLTYNDAYSLLVNNNTNQNIAGKKNFVAGIDTTTLDVHEIYLNGQNLTTTLAQYAPSTNAVLSGVTTANEVQVVNNQQINGNLNLTSNSTINMPNGSVLNVGDNNISITSENLAQLQNLQNNIQNSFTNLNSTISTISNNQINDENHLSNLDISFNTINTKLLLDENHLTILDVSFNTLNTKVLADENHLTILDVSFNTLNTKVLADENHLTILDVSFNTLNTKVLADETHLSILDTSYNLLNLLKADKSQSLYSYTYYVNSGVNKLSDVITQIGNLTSTCIFLSPNGLYEPSNNNVNITQTNLTICAPDCAFNSPSTSLYFPVTLTSASNRIRVSNISFQNNFTIDGSVGRHAFKACTFQSNFSLTGSMTNFLTFYYCTFSGQINVPNTFAGFIIFYFCDFTGATLNFNQASKQQIYINSCNIVPNSVNATVDGFNTNITGGSTLNSSTLNVSNSINLPSNAINISNVNGLSTRLSTDETNISTNTTNITQNTASITQNTNDISNLKPRVTTAEGYITALQGSVGQIQSKQITDENNIASIQSTLPTKANLDSPNFTGIPQCPTAIANSNNYQIANTSYVDTQISNLIGTSPSLLNTLQEIDNAINNDPNFSTTITNQLSLKANIDNPTFTTRISTPAINLNGNDLQSTLNTYAKLNNPTFTGVVNLPSTIDNGSLTCNNGLSVTAGSVSFPSKSISQGAINNTPIASGYVDFTSSGQNQINSLNTSINSINTNITGISYSASAGTTINNNLIAKSITDNGSLVVSNGISVTGSVSFPNNSISTTAINNNGYFALSSTLNSYLTTANAASTYQPILQLDTIPTSNSVKYVNSGAIYNALSNYALSSALSSYLLSSTASSTYQQKLTFDSTPTSASSNSLTSGSIYTTLQSYALSSALNNYLTTANAVATYQPILAYDTQPVASSTKILNSGSLYTTLQSYALSSSLSSYLTTSSAALTYQTISGMSSYLTTSSASTTYSTITSLNNLINGTTSYTGFTNSGPTNLNGLTNILELSETNSSVSVSSGIATCNYNNGAVFYITNQTANFTVALTNLSPSANKSYSITLLINASSNKFYANQLTINGTTTSFIYNGGSSNVSVSSASYILQQFNIVYTSSGTTPQVVITSIGQIY